MGLRFALTVDIKISILTCLYVYRPPEIMKPKLSTLNVSLKTFVLDIYMAVFVKKVAYMKLYL